MWTHLGEFGLSAWLYLLLAHLVADFLLQPYELVKLKGQPLGLAIHSGVHAIVTAVLVAPFLPRWWLIVPVLSVVHYFIDWMKVAGGHTDGPRSLVAFLGDQVLHLIALTLAVLAAGLAPDAHVTYVSPRITSVLYYAIPYLTATFAGAILLYQIALAFHTRPNPAQALTLAPRFAGIIERGLALTVVLFLPPSLWWVAAVPAAVILWPDRTERGRWVETAGGLGFAFILGLVFRQ